MSPYNIRTEAKQPSAASAVDWENLTFGRTFSDHMFVVDFDGQDWVDPRIVPYGPMSFDPAISAIHYGQSIFEGLKAYKGADGKVRVFRPEMNARRLNHSATRMCMATLPESLFLEGLNRLLALDSDWVYPAEGYSLYIRPFMFATEAYLGIKPSDTYRFIIMTSPVKAYYQGAIRVKVERHYTRAASGGTGSAKAAGNYAASLYPAKLAQEQGFRQLIWTDAASHEYLEESGTMNLFFMKNGVLHTPSTESDTILSGVTRDSILSLAKSWGVPVETRRIKVTELQEGLREGSVTELFGAGTAATIAQIESIRIDEEDFTPPPVEERQFSNKVAKTLSGIKTGALEDSFGWVHLIG